MESFHVNTLKLKKVNAVRRYRQLQKVTNLFRILEICAILIIVSKFSTELPIAIKFSSGYFKDLSIFLFSSRFVFLLGNTIIIILFAKSGQFSLSKMNCGIGFHEETVENYGSCHKIGENGAEKEGRESIPEEKTVMVDSYISSDMRIYRKSQSEKLKKSENYEKGRRLLPSSATDGCRNSNSSGEKLVKQNSYPADNLSNEEFRRAVEEFIARQQKFRREEEEYSPFVI